MVGKTKATAAEKRRLKTIKEHMPCLPCLLTIDRVRLPTVQHVVSGFTREGNCRTYASCEWHHLGIRPDGWSRQAISGLLGVSLTMGKRTFQSDYGPESVLIEVQDFLLAQFESRPWFDYNIAVDVRRKAIDLWMRLKQ